MVTQLRMYSDLYFRKMLKRGEVTIVMSAWVQEDNCNWGGGGGGHGGGGANPFILLHVMLKNYDTITKKEIEGRSKKFSFHITVALI